MEPATSTKSTRTDSRTNGNKRYVGFLVKGKVPQRSDLIHLLNRSTPKGEPTPWLSFYEEGKVIIRCTDNNRDLMVSILEKTSTPEGSMTIESKITSGSIRKVKRYLAEVSLK